jgi:hypothetical protein
MHRPPRPPRPPPRFFRRRRPQRLGETILPLYLETDLMVSETLGTPAWERGNPSNLPEDGDDPAPTIALPFSKRFSRDFTFRASTTVPQRALFSLPPSPTNGLLANQLNSQRFRRSTDDGPSRGLDYSPSYALGRVPR